MKNTVRFDTPYEGEEEVFPRSDEGRESFNGYAISENSNISHRHGGYGSHRPFQDLIFVLYGLNEYQKQRLESEIFHQGGNISPTISDQVIFNFKFFFFFIFISNII